MAKKNRRVRPETFRLGPRLLDATRGINSRAAMEVRLQARYKGLEPDHRVIGITPDGTLLSADSFQEFAEKARAYREGR